MKLYQNITKLVEYAKWENLRITHGERIFVKLTL